MMIFCGVYGREVAVNCAASCLTNEQRSPSELCDRVTRREATDTGKLATYGLKYNLNGLLYAFYNSTKDILSYN